MHFLHPLKNCTFLTLHFFIFDTAFLTEEFFIDILSRNFLINMQFLKHSKILFQRNQNAETRNCSRR